MSETNINSAQGSFTVSATVTSVNIGTQGSVSGIFAPNTLGTLTNAGTIQVGGSHAAVVGTAINYVDNAGAIIDTGTMALLAIGQSLGTLTNSGLISSMFGEIYINGSLGTLTNSATGTITANSETTIYVQGNVGTLTNAGIITNNNGQALQLFSTADIVNQAGGTISAFEVTIAANTGSTIENAGTISVTDPNGYAIGFNGNGPGGLGAGTLIIDPGSSITGQVAAYGGTLVLNGVGALDVTGIGTQYAGFSTLSFANNDATAEGNVAALSGGTTITGMVNGDSLILDGFSAISETYISGTGLVLSDANSNTATLDITGVGTTPDFQFSTDGNNTTLTLSASLVISTAVTAQNISTDNVDITPTGSVTGQINAALSATGNVASITNAGYIQGNNGQTAISVQGSIESLSNSGTISGVTDLGSADGILAQSIGTLTNSGLITGDTAVFVNAGKAAIYNAIGGTISGAEAAIYTTGPAIIENAGTITSPNNLDGAIYFGNANSTLIIDPTSTIIGAVQASLGGTLTLNGSSALDVTGIGTQYTGFTTYNFANSDATLEGNVAGLASGQSITGLQSGDSIVLDGFAATIATYEDTYLNNTGLLLTNASGQSEMLDITGVGKTPDFELGTDGTNTTIELLCFLRGTKIRTAEGQTPVEQLQPGDLVRTLSGALRPITWIGTGHAMVPAGHRSPATPVLIRRGALGPNTPSEDLRVTKGHAIYQNNLLIPAEFLINHRSILWDDAAREVEYYHIELSTHDVVLANNAPAETYRDEGNRWMFQNANPLWDQHRVEPYAPVLTGGPLVDEIWQNLLALSGQNLNPPTTTQADIYLLVDGQRIEGQRLSKTTLSFTLPTNARHITIASRAAAQDMLGRFRDPRTLGIALSSLVLWHGNTPHAFYADEMESWPGLHAYEPAEGCIWTNGCAQLPPQPQPPTKLHLHIAHTTHYPLPATHEKAA